ncbi:hypothetical protein D1953_18155 [Peribacillus asahii]|uniref:Uncharacterized protein n=1 Tax=Peribacillus asahii TaxID=228899 RepID=A0A398AXQ4_9BACI|nr:hypothetical protein [Peribacillus asahii]RID82407.1 hypothetical protein D1953_18155 [Peribacillus asahii]
MGQSRKRQQQRLVKQAGDLGQELVQVIEELARRGVDSQVLLHFAIGLILEILRAIEEESNES